jgi:Membrane bound FAD containing D-sorbitol dehydrogenase
MDALEDFLDLSTVLTGVSPLSRSLAEEYLERLKQVPEFAELPKLTKIFKEQYQSANSPDRSIHRQIVEQDDLRGLIKVIILLWYTGEVYSTVGQEGGHPEHYFQGLLWSVVHAHPPGLSGGYFGYWAYPPEN